MNDKKIVCNGPLTELAAKLKADPDYKKDISEIHILGGALWRGDSTPGAEKNIYKDPDAADYVFKSGIPIIWYPKDIISEYTNVGFIGADSPVRRPIDLSEYNNLPNIYDSDPDSLMIVDGGVQVETKGSVSIGKTVNDLFSDAKYEIKNVRVVLGFKL
jgi:inosine-uridine nucleoside N-ribohydrolase